MKFGVVASDEQVVARAAEKELDVRRTLSPSSPIAVRVRVRAVVRCLRRSRRPRGCSGSSSRPCRSCLRLRRRRARCPPSKKSLPSTPRKWFADGLPKKLSLLLPPVTFSTSSRTLSSSLAGSRRRWRSRSARPRAGGCATRRSAVSTRAASREHVGAEPAVEAVGRRPRPKRRFGPGLPTRTSPCEPPRADSDVGVDVVALSRPSRVRLVGGVVDGDADARRALVVRRRDRRPSRRPDRLRRRSRRRRSAAAPSAKVSLPVLAVLVVVAEPAGDRVVARAAADHVRSGASGERVLARAADEVLDVGLDVVALGRVRRRSRSPSIVTVSGAVREA